MSVAPAVPPGEPMSWEEYTRRGCNPPSEYINGRLVMVPPPTRQHQSACRWLANQLEAVIPEGYEVTEAWGWKIGKDEFIPDVMVHPVTNENVRFTGVPLLVVEVMSSNRANDLVLKVLKYARGGASNYWILDPRDRVLNAFALGEDGAYVPLAEVDDTTGPVEIPLGDSIFRADIAALLPA